jgi:hypothetical protein
VIALPVKQQATTNGAAVERGVSSYYRNHGIEKGTIAVGTADNSSQGFYIGVFESQKKV